jgi:serine/threonine-protein kinase
MSLAADICGALDFSHRNGIVHRDVKPGNVMITPQGSVKVMDFGIARAVSDSAATMTSTAAVIGTAQYLSPEQARGEGVDARSDVYSLGCLLYELVTGAPPFTGDSPVAVAYQHVREDPKLPSSINPRVPAELDAILLKAMSKNPANRYQSAADMRSDLLRALAGQRVEATPVMGDAEKTAIIGGPVSGYGFDDRDDDDWEAEEEEARRRKRRIIAIVAVAAVLLIGGAIAAFALLGNDEEPTAPTVQQVAVPVLIGQPRAAAEAALEEAGLVLGDVTPRITENEAEVGTVLDSTPASGAEVDEGTEVDLVVGAAPDTVAIPNVVGLSEDAARSTLEDAGFGSVSSREVESLEGEGSVVAVDPAEGTPVPPSQTITLSVSSGTITMPEVTGQQVDAATQALSGQGLTNVTTEEVESDQPAGTVLGSNPAAGNQVGAGTRITLQVSSGPAAPETIAVPNVAGLESNVAEDRLTQDEFSVTVVTLEVADPSVDPGQAVRTDPPAGTRLERGSDIALFVNPPEGG